MTELEQVVAECERLQRERDELLDIMTRALMGPFSTPRVMEIYIKQRLREAGYDPDALIDAAIAANRPLRVVE